MSPVEQTQDEIEQAEAAQATAAAAEVPVKADEEAAAAPAAPALSEAEQTLEIMATLGLTKENAQQVVGAARAFQQYGYLIEKDPRQFAKILKTQSPEVYENFINGMTDEYLETHEAQATPAPAAPKGGDPNSAAASREFLQLKQQVETITGAIQSANNAAAYQGVVAGYRDKVEELVGKLELTKPGEIRAIKSMLRDSLEADPGATQRIYQGNYVDVARHVQKVMKEFTDDAVADNKAEHATRERTVASGKKEVTSGPVNNGKSSNPADSWDNAEMALANALTKGRK